MSKKHINFSRISNVKLIDFQPNFKHGIINVFGKLLILPGDIFPKFIERKIWITRNTYKIYLKNYFKKINNLSE